MDGNDWNAGTGDSASDWVATSTWGSSGPSDDTAPETSAAASNWGSGAADWGSASTFDSGVATFGAVPTDEQTRSTDISVRNVDNGEDQDDDQDEGEDEDEEGFSDPDLDASVVGNSHTNASSPPRQSQTGTSPWGDDSAIGGFDPSGSATGSPSPFTTSSRFDSAPRGTTGDISVAYDIPAEDGSADGGDDDDFGSPDIPADAIQNEDSSWATSTAGTSAATSSWETSTEESAAVASSWDAPAADLPAAASASAWDTPAVDQPSTTSSSWDTPAADLPAATSSSWDAPAVEQPSTTSSSWDAPATDPPAATSSSWDAPAVEQPSTTSSSWENPAVEQPSTTSSSWDAPAVEEASTPTSSWDAPATDPPVAASSSWETPAVEQPSTTRSSWDTPAADLPAATSSSWDALATDPPAATSSSWETPAVEQPSTTSSSWETPAVEEASTPTSSWENPAVEQPSTTSSSCPAVEEASTTTSSWDAPATDPPAATSSSWETPAVEQPSTAVDASISWSGSSDTAMQPSEPADMLPEHEHEHESQHDSAVTFSPSTVPAYDEYDNDMYGLEDGEQYEGIPIERLVGFRRPRFRFGTINQLLCFDQSKGGEIAVLRHHQYNRQVRLLLNAWHTVFRHLHQDATARVGAEERAHKVYEASKRYRAELQAFLLTAQDSSDTTDPLEQQEYDIMVEYLGLANSIWHLVEIFFFDPYTNVTKQLRTWMHESFPVPTFDPRDDESEFWRVLYLCVIQGRIDSAIEMLASNVHLRHQHTSAVTQLVELLSSIPSVSATRWNVEEFKSDFASWKQQLTALLEAGTVLSSHSDIRTLVELLMGNRDVIAEYSESCHDMLTGYMLFAYPTATKEDISSIFEECKEHEKWSDDQREDDTIKIFQTIVAMDAGAAVRIVEQVVDLPLVMAHLIDLFRITGDVGIIDRALWMQPTADVYDRTSLYERFTTEYALTLMDNPTLWQMAVDYLETCPKHGRSYIKVLVTSQCIDNDFVAFKLLDICSRHGLEDEQRAICTQLGTKALKRGNYGTATYWFVRAKDVMRVSRICDDVLRQTLEAQHAESNAANADANATIELIEAVVDNAGDITFSNDLIFLSKYHEMKLLLDEIKQKEADALALTSSMQDTSAHRDFAVRLRAFEDSKLGATAMQFHTGTADAVASTNDLAIQCWEMKRRVMEILVRIIDYGVAPRQYWLLLLLEVLPYLESTKDVPILSAQDTCKLMSCVEDITLSHQSERYTSLITPQQVDMIRLGLVRNFSRAVMNESSLAPSAAGRTAADLSVDLDSTTHSVTPHEYTTTQAAMTAVPKHSTHSLHTASLMYGGTGSI
jgi:Nup85 Nucleoporin